MLTKDDIDNEILKTSHQDEIRHSLSNYFEGLDEPVAVVIGINEKGCRDCDDAANINKMVTLLRQNGIDAVSFLDEEAVKPDKFVVNSQGVLFPFMSPQDALKATVEIENLMLDNGLKLVGHANPLTSKAILYPAPKGISYDKKVDLEFAHPNKDLFHQIEAHNGGDYKNFIAERVKFAYENSFKIDINQRSLENVAQGVNSLFRGATLGGNPYAVVSESNSRKVAHSSPALSVCVGFSGKGSTQSTRGGGVYEGTSDGLYYGFVYEFESMGDEQIYYQNVGLETGWHSKKLEESNKSWSSHDGDIYETPVLPHHNKLKAIYLHVDHSNVGISGEDGSDVALHRFYAIPLDENGQIKDQKWQDFLELHEPTDSAVLGYVAQRQATQKQEQTNNPQHGYQFEKRELSPKFYEDVSQMHADKFVAAFVHSGSLERQGEEIVCSEAVNLFHMGIKKIPDLSNVRIEGEFAGGDLEEVSATKLPKSDHVFMPKTIIYDGDRVDADRFCQILGYKKDNEGVYRNIYNACSVKQIKGCPADISSIVIEQINFPIEVNKIADLPKTEKGIFLGEINIADQSDIKDMSLDDFYAFLHGSKGLEQYKFYHDKKLPYGEFDIDLSHTNIAVLPSCLKNEDNIHSIILNKNTRITSLDDFPVLPGGFRGKLYNLNFDGDLKNETMESFLLKTKGREYIQKYTEKAEDGHLIIKDLDFTFSTDRLDDSNDNRLPMIIRSFPKDIATVEFKCEITEQDRPIMDDIELYKKLQQQKHNEELHVYGGSGNMNLDLSEHNARKVNITGKQSKIIFPPQTESVSFDRNDNFNNSLLKSIPEGVRSISLLEVKFAEDLDCRGFVGKGLYFNDVSTKSLKLPTETETLTLNNVKSDDDVNWSINTKDLKISNLELSEKSNVNLTTKDGDVQIENCSFPKGATIDFSQAKRVSLINVDLSEANIIMPKEAYFVNIGEGVKFPEGYKLDLSKCRSGDISPDIMVDELKLPKEPSDVGERIILPNCVKEVPTSFMRTCKHVDIPQGTKIIDDWHNSKGRPMSTKDLEEKGVSKEKIKEIKKERLNAKWKRMLSIVKKILPEDKKVKSFKSNPVKVKQLLALRQGVNPNLTDGKIQPNNKRTSKPYIRGFNRDTTSR